MAAARDADKPIDLTGVVFPGDIDFAEIAGEDKVLPGISLAGAIILGKADFRGITFTARCQFNGIKFIEGATFDKATFEALASFEPVSGLSYAEFGHCSFVNTRFRHKAYFDFCLFHDCTFREAVFGQVTSFNNATFHVPSDFTKAWFEGMASFENTKFPEAIFQEVTVGGDVSFRDAYFEREAYFKRAAFHSDADFSAEITSDKSDKRQTFPSVSFQNATFLGHTTFANRHFLGPTDFSRAKFKVAPVFHGCSLHQDTDFRKTQFRDDRGTAEVDAARAYRTLRQAMEFHRARREQGMFYALEQRALRKSGQLKGVAPKLFSLLYDWTADYGRSFGLPFAWLALVTFFSFALYFELFHAEGLPRSGAALSFTIEQIVRPFFVWTSSYKPPSDIMDVWEASKWPFRLVATAQSLISFGLLTLFILALRRTFKMD